MKNQLTTVWGVTAGRQVGGITKRFHKKREGSQAEREVAKAHSITLKEARRVLRYAQAANKRKDAATIEGEALKLEVSRQRRLSDATVKSASAELERAARVAAYLKTQEQ